MAVESEKRDEDGKIPVVTSALSAPTVYADGLLFATRLGQNIRLTFAETILEPNDSPAPGLKYRHVGTLVLPSDGFASMMSYLNTITPEFLLPEGKTDAG